MLVHQPVDGGVGRHVADLAGGLAQRDHEIVLCGPAPPVGLRRLPARVRHFRLELLRSPHPRADLAALWRLATIVRHTRPDVIHAHSSKAGALARAGRVLWPGVPVVYTPHGYAFAGFFENRWERLRYREIERLLAPLSTRVTCVCEAEARLAATVGSRARVRVVYNGVDLPEPGPVDPRMAELARRGPVVCVLTQLRPGKGIETLIDAAPIARASHPALQIAIWGDGPERDALRARAADGGIGEITHMLGSSDDPVSALRGAAMLVHPSLAEAFPYAILEAMSVATPVLASDVGGIGEALGDERGGLLVAPGDPAGLAQAMIGLLDAPERAARIGEEGRQAVRLRFSRAAMVDRLEDIYSEVSDRSDLQ